MKHAEIYFMIQNYSFFILIGLLVLIMFGLGIAYLVNIIKEKVKRKRKTK